MKFKLSAGGEIDILTRRELSETLREVARDWQVEASRGPRPIRWWGMGTVDSAGALSMGGEGADMATSGRWGPDPGFVWAVKRWNLRNIEDGKTISAWINDNNDSRSIRDGLTGYNDFGSDELVLLSADRLLFTGSGMTAGRVITVAGGAWELPATMMYRLM
jgi:hypothetical protein